MKFWGFFSLTVTLGFQQLDSSTVCFYLILRRHSIGRIIYGLQYVVFYCDQLQNSSALLGSQDSKVKGYSVLRKGGMNKLCNVSLDLRCKIALLSHMEENVSPS